MSPLPHVPPAPGNRTGPAPHRMAGALFDAVAAGGGGAEALRLLARAEHSRRLACLYAVREAGLDAGGAVARQTGEAWELIAAADRAAPAAVAAVLTHPSAGPTLLDLLTRLLRGPAGEEPPVHRLTALAAACAARAGVPGRTRWPVSGPWVTLPALGRARFPGARAGDTAELRVGAGGRATLRVPGAPGPGPLVVPAGDPYRTHDRWRGPVLLARLGPGAPLLLDTLDAPCFPNAPDRPRAVTEAQRRRWTSLAHDARALLRADHPEVWAELAAGPRLLVPLAGSGRGSVSGSSAETFGCVALSPPESAAGFAVTLAHEMQHTKLAALLHLFDFLEPGDGPLYYAPWRPDPRPLLGLVHGAYAHLGVARFWDRRRVTEPDPVLRADAHARFARWRTAARDAALLALGSGRLTPLGRRFGGHMLDTLEGLCALPVPPSAQRRAAAAAEAHRATWAGRTEQARRLPA
ncbi:HEXXH motif-containing putative peptide modification protein [Streptomyces sp. AM 2-1-1]|uniref:aKG-HExxH-type peptide beta-hydroxylase n=1 Tax=Streptomyces sp. AM 2-1-1 TaxID=3028709 RepID=UPI0023BA2DCC|nr:HEXXH motif-containing putative peptide modification protein [Streptomyces sp. AM 2-1-1]WEH39878.1 HEXXH motif-containing putative peptide modification protein [Streptomyces sp. AM 2-1-1]